MLKLIKSFFKKAEQPAPLEVPYKVEGAPVIAPPVAEVISEAVIKTKLARAKKAPAVKKAPTVKKPRTPKV